VNNSLIPKTSAIYTRCASHPFQPSSEHSTPLPTHQDSSPRQTARSTRNSALPSTDHPCQYLSSELCSVLPPAKTCRIQFRSPKMSGRLSSHQNSSKLSARKAQSPPLQENTINTPPPPDPTIAPPAMLLYTKQHTSSSPGADGPLSSMQSQVP